MNMQDIKFKFPNACDLDILHQVSEIENEAFREDALSVFNISLLARIKAIIVAMKDCEVVAETQLITNPDNTALILGFAVAKAYRQQKVGKQFLGYLIKYARNRKLDSLILTTNPENIPAMNLYLKTLNFIIKDKNICHPSNNETRWLLEKKLNGDKT